MSFINESLTIGLLLAIVFGALFFYLYTRLTYTEKRFSLMENILLDIKMNQEQKPLHVLPPIPQGISFQNTLIPVQEDIEVLPSVHEEVNEINEINDLNDVNDVNDVNEYTDLLNQVHSEELTVSDSITTPLPSSPNYDSMSKDELVELVKKRGLRAGNRPGREKLIGLLQKADEVEPSGGSFTNLQEAITNE